jgi:hypothetical protein
VFNLPSIIMRQVRGGIFSCEALNLLCSYMLVRIRRTRKISCVFKEGLTRLEEA